MNNWLQKRIDDHRIEFDYKYKSEQQNPEGKKSVLGIKSAWWHCTTPRTTWPPKTKVRSFFFFTQVRVVMIHIALHGSRLKGVAHVIPSIHDERISSTLSFPFSSSSSFSRSSLISSTSSTTLEPVASLCTPSQRVWTLLTRPIPSQDRMGTQIYSCASWRYPQHKQ